MSRCRAFTLAEVLAAVVLLAMLACAAFPLAHRLMNGEAALAARREAEAMLREQLQAQRGQLVAGDRAVDGTAWRLRCVPLLSDHPRRTDVPGWWVVTLVDVADRPVTGPVLVAAPVP